MDWLKGAVASAGTAAANAAQMTKLKGDMMFLDRDLVNRKSQFGVDLYDFIAPLSIRADFFTVSDKMTDTVRGPFLAAQREVSLYENRRGKLKEQLTKAEADHKAAFPTAAASFGEHVLNAGKASTYVANETKIKTEISMAEAEIKAQKQEFGVKLFDVFVQLEDRENWLPTIRDIRGMYDATRQDVEGIQKKKLAKAAEMDAIYGGTAEQDAAKAEIAKQSGNASVFAGGNGGPLDPTSAAAPGASSYTREPPAPAAVAPTPYPANGGFPTENDSFNPAPAIQTGGGGYPTANGSFNPAPARKAPVATEGAGLFSYPSSQQQPSSSSFSAQAQAALSHDPFAAAPAAPAPVHDPFAAAPVAPAPTRAHDPFAAAAPAAVPAPMHDPFASAAPLAPTPMAPANDPFSSGFQAQPQQFQMPKQEPDDPFAGL